MHGLGEGVCGQPAARHAEHRRDERDGDEHEDDVRDHGPILRWRPGPTRGASRAAWAAGPVGGCARRRGRRRGLGGHDRRDGLVDVVGDGEQVEVAQVDRARLGGGAAQPVEQPAPVGGADQHDREAGDLLGLHQGHRLEQLVEGAEPAGQHDEALGVLDEHRLAGEEVAEVDAEVDELVEPGLEGQLDAEPDRRAAGLEGPPVRGLHGAGAAAGDDGVAGLDQRRADPDAELVGRVVGAGARRAEHADRRADLGQRPEAGDELGLDAHDPPRVGVQPVGRAPAVEQALRRWSSRAPSSPA